MNKLRVLDLFSGIGGFSLGLERTKFFETIAFCEADKHCREVLKKHWPSTDIINDILQCSFEENFADIVTGGFPCQDISFAGAQKGIIKGSKSSLWNEMARVINEVKPKYAIIENVEHLRKNGLGIVLNDLSRIGYDAEWHCITARSAGYAHQRKRLFIIAYPSCERFHECAREERRVQADKKRTSKEIYSGRAQCESESREVCEILSRGKFDRFTSTNSSRKPLVPGVRRVTNGIPKGLDERARKERIKQLGNSIIPDIAEIIGLAIIESYEREPSTPVRPS